MSGLFMDATTAKATSVDAAWHARRNTGIHGTKGFHRDGMEKKRAPLLPRYKERIQPGSSRARGARRAAFGGAASGGGAAARGASWFAKRSSSSVESSEGIERASADGAVAGFAARDVEGRAGGRSRSMDRSSGRGGVSGWDGAVITRGSRAVVLVAEEDASSTSRLVSPFDAHHSVSRSKRRTSSRTARDETHGAEVDAMRSCVARTFRARRLRV